MEPCGSLRYRHPHEHHFDDRRSLARLAPAQAHEPDGSGARGRHLHPTSQLSRNRPLATEPRDGAAAGGATRVPLRERNVLLVAAGFAPVYSQRALDDPALAAAREAVDLVLKGHEPYPALAIDRHWSLVAANAALMPLDRRRRSRASQAAGQRSAPEPASGRACVAHREFQRMARSSSGAPAPAGRCHGRCRSDEADGGIARAIRRRERKRASPRLERRLCGRARAAAARQPRADR